MSKIKSIENLLQDAGIPAFYKVKYNICSDEIVNIEAAVLGALQQEDALSTVHAGARVAITAGSREVNHIDVILKTLIGALTARGAKPFIIPAMGSHGGATAEGQKKMLEQLNITSGSMGVPVVSSMETVKIGSTDTGIPVQVAKDALAADYIIPVGRIKPHTDFKGRYESGLMKMMAIGLGKQQGAAVCHKLGIANMSQNVLAIGKKVLETCSIPFGIGIIENAFHGTYRIVAVPAEKIEQEEPKLLEEAKALVPVIPFEKIDIIVCEEMGKDISGTGIDSNVVGRSSSLGVSRPYAEKIGVFRLTEKSHGNANGMGLADCITRRFLETLEFEQTYPNAITSAETNAVKIPAVMETDELCVKFLIKTCTGSGRDGLRIVWIKNTLSLDDFYISGGLYKEALRIHDLKTEDTPHRVTFDSKGCYMQFQSILQRRPDITEIIYEK